ncbi:hypothetical protein CLF_104252 [Clonorchis sinensis]|uniref:Uncharacterized protein n=1 Tax=Clonorchis sinensis TaxID=79923 RepID=G7YB87_CLOSI|nr:hypothetical protein CLF_104252 [Clonorchis sinensis]
MRDVFPILPRGHPTFHQAISFVFGVKSTFLQTTQRVERLKIDFKGSLPSKARNKHILTVTDAYCRLALACRHSGRGSAFISDGNGRFFYEKTSPAVGPLHTRQGGWSRGTSEKATMLLLRSKGLQISHSGAVLQNALH